MIPSVRGTQDIWPSMWRQHNWIIDTAREKARQFGFQEVSLPILEHEALFKRSAGEASDIVMKEMYTLSPKGAMTHGPVVLRPEGTAPTMRAVYDQGIQTPTKLLYWGPMFRYDRPQKGRLRQFHQIGCESLQTPCVWSDIDTLCLAHQFLRDLGVSATLHMNTLGSAEDQKRYRQSLGEFLQNQRQQFSSLAQEKIQRGAWLRLWDTKNPDDHRVLAKAPALWDALSPDSQERFQTILTSLDRLKIDYHWNQALVRGLDYYAHTVFEWKSAELGAQDTILAGGRYDTLMTTLSQGKRTMPAMGWACGIERLMLLTSPPDFDTSEFWGVTYDDACNPEIAYPWVSKLRDQNHRVVFSFQGSSLRKRLQALDKMNVQHSLVVSDEQTAWTKDMVTGQQKTVHFE